MPKVCKKLCMSLLILLIVAVIPFAVNAAEEEVAFEYPQYYNATQGYEYGDISSYMTEEFELYLKDQFANCKSSFPIDAFEIPYSENTRKQLQNYIWYEMPEAFNVSALGISDSNWHLDTIYVQYQTYADTIQEYKNCSDKMVLAAEQLLEGIRDNSQLTDVEKALLLHDRLAIWTAYDYKNYVAGTLPKTVYSAYGALGLQSTVCMGYTLAYTYLLEQVGIESDYCASDSMDHAWNIVYLDGKGYHVDVTWDDVTPDRVGYVSHNNFLRSTAGIIATGHDGGDFNTTPSSTTYDSYYWQNTNASFVLLGNDIYYADDGVETIYRVDGQKKEAILNIANSWPTKDGHNWIGLSSLDTWGNSILYSQPDGVYALDPVTKATALVYAADLSQSEYHTLHGFKCEKDYLYISVRDLHEHDSYDELQSVYLAPKDGTFTVTFRDKDNSILSTNTYYFGDVPVQPALDPTIDYEGYYDVWNNQVTICKGNAEYIKTEKKTDKYRVEFVDWDDTVLSYAWYELGDTVTPPPDPTRAEDAVATYEFIAWEGPWIDCTGHMTIRPFYQTTYKQYTITFLDWDGTVIAEDYFYYGDPVEMYDPERPDDVLYSYTFVGWDKEVTVCLGEAVYQAVYEKTPHIQTGWVQDGDTWYYMNKGKPVVGWFAYGPVWYYFNGDGTMFQGFLYYGGHWYFFNDIGRMHTGWAEYQGKWYYMDANGYRVTGIVTINGEKNRFDENGVWLGVVVDKNGWVKEGNDWFYYKDGVMVTGWLQLGNTWYYFKTSGQMVTGWLKYGPVWYYFTSDGAMYQNQWLYYGGHYYYFGDIGRMVANNWVNEAGKWYYFDGNGYMVTGNRTIGGKVYNFNQNGVCLNP